MDVQVEMDHPCLSHLQHGHGTAAQASTVLQAKAQTKSFTAEQVHHRSRFYRKAARGIGSDAGNALSLCYDGLLGSPTARFGPCICSGCRSTLIQQVANVQLPYDIRTMRKTLFTQRPYELRKVKDIWFATRHNIHNWLKNMFG